MAFQLMHPTPSEERDSSRIKLLSTRMVERDQRLLNNKARELGIDRSALDDQVRVRRQSVNEYVASKAKEMESMAQIVAAQAAEDERVQTARRLRQQEYRKMLDLQVADLKSKNRENVDRTRPDFANSGILPFPQQASGYHERKHAMAKLQEDILRQQIFEKEQQRIEEELREMREIRAISEEADGGERVRQAAQQHQSRREKIKNLFVEGNKQVVARQEEQRALARELDKKQAEAEMDYVQNKSILNEALHNRRDKPCEFKWASPTEYMEAEKTLKAQMEARGSSRERQAAHDREFSQRLASETAAAEASAAALASRRRRMQQQVLRENMELAKERRETWSQAEKMQKEIEAKSTFFDQWGTRLL